MLKSLYVPELQEGCSVLEAALEYVKAGWYVLPVVGKKPAIAEWSKNSTCDADKVVKLFSASKYFTGVALHMGRSGAVGIDVDDPGKFKFAANITQGPFQSTRSSQPNRGHYIFLQPLDRVVGNGGSGEWGEVRGLNGYLVVAPSRHPEPDGEYWWRRVGKVPPLPLEIAKLLPTSVKQENNGTKIENNNQSQTVKNFLRLNGNASPKLLNYVARRMQIAIEDGVGRHTAAYEHTCWMVREVRAGLYPALVGIDTLFKVFQQSIDQQQESVRYKQAEVEFENIVRHAIASTKDEATIIQARLATPSSIKVNVAGQKTSLYRITSRRKQPTKMVKL